jgi:hypothetical protein
MNTTERIAELNTSIRLKIAAEKDIETAIFSLNASIIKLQRVPEYTEEVGKLKSIRGDLQEKFWMLRNVTY